MTRGEIKYIIRTNLADLGVVNYSEATLNDSLQDAYDDIAVLTQFNVKEVTLNWRSGLSYYNFPTLGVADYLMPVAIFNNITNRYLRDDLNLRDFDRIRRDWENWTGTPQFWAPSDPYTIAIAAKYTGTVVSGAFDFNSFSSAFYIGTGFAALGSFLLTYSAIAPQWVDDNDTPLIATDVQNLFEFYCTADMLEQFEEFSKANEYWERYWPSIDNYAARVKANNKADLLLRV